MLADEPTGNLDDRTAGEITELFKSLAHGQEKCVIVVTHSKDLAKEADVILQIKDLVDFGFAYFPNCTACIGGRDHKIKVYYC